MSDREVPAARGEVGETNRGVEEAARERARGLRVLGGLRLGSGAEWPCSRLVAVVVTFR